MSKERKMHVQDFWENQEVWVSGATGAWGKEIIRQLLMFPVAKVVAFCRGEHRAYQLREESDERVQIYLGDIRDGKRITRSLTGCHTAIHTAALKRVDAFTYSPTEIQDTNINGTIRVIEGIIEQGVDRGFYISSDKACLPTTFYGATKFIAEQLWLSASDCGPCMVAGRFGNALSSTGSVLQVWKRELEQGETITITNPLMTRYIITLPDVVDQILRHLIPTGAPGRLMYADMPAVTIGQLAKVFAPHARWKVVGSRGYGEKLHEMLWWGSEYDYKSSETGKRLSNEELEKLIAPYREEK